MIRLGVNVDHVATLREARKTSEPDPVEAAKICEATGAHGITVHLREDRRHIQDRDLYTLRKTVRTKLNLEMATIKSIVDRATEVRPDQATLVPERREEITTEGGLDVVKNLDEIKETVAVLKRSGIVVSLFIDPDASQIAASAESGADAVELHTGAYANLPAPGALEEELSKLMTGAERAHANGLHVNAGHGLNYVNIKEMLKLPYLEEVNIGHSIISRAVMVGLERAVREMLGLLKGP